VDITGWLSTSVSGDKAKVAKALLTFLASREAAPAYEEEKIFPAQ
jgi:hypothetical protein